MSALLQAAIDIVRTLRDAGHVAYLAGGCVRDQLLGIEPKDYDVATDAPPERVKARLPGAKLVGESFGVVMVPVRVGRQRRYIEVATFRKEWGYVDGRRPDHVVFTDARTDAQRRDFTINGLFLDPLADESASSGPAAASDPSSGRDPLVVPQGVIDYVGGVADLRAGLIRAIGDPAERFGEDYLRMLRAVRFAARLGFAIEPVTARAIRNHARYLGQISRERIGQEIQWMLTADVDQPRGREPAQAAAAANLIQQLHLDAPALNEDHREPALPTVQRLAGWDYPTVLAAWMTDRHGEPDESTCVTLMRRWRSALALSNQERDDLAQTLAIARDLKNWESLTLAQRKRLLARPRSKAAMALYAARHEARRIQTEAEDLRAQGVAPPPWITGEDLIAQGCVPGPQFKIWLDQVYDAQLEGRVTDRAEALAMLERIIRATAR